MVEREECINASMHVMTDMHMYVHVHREQIKCDKHVKILIPKPYVHIHTEQIKCDKHAKILIPKSYMHVHIEQVKCDKKNVKYWYPNLSPQSLPLDIVL